MPVPSRALAHGVIAVAASLSFLGAGAAAPAVAGSVIHAPALVRHSTSSNWSGYAATGGPFHSISASWTQPAGHCTSQRTYSSFWVGLDGDGSNSVEQTGSAVDCVGGRARYYAWYEMYPKYPVNFGNPVAAGDHFTASVSAAAGGRFTLKITNSTKGWSHTVHQTYAAARLYSAEAIAEAPSSRAGVLPLTDFHIVRFTGTKANGRPIGSFHPDRITMASGGKVKSSCSGLSNRLSFSCSWHHR